MLNLVFGCSNFLDEENLSNYTQDNYFKESSHAEASINAIYSTLRFVNGGGDFYGESPFMMLEFPTGLANTEVGQSQNNNTLRTLTADADNSYVYNWWRNSYLGISNANLSIARIPELEMDEKLKLKLLGEAYFLRAFYYYNLVRIFGDIPLIINPVDANSTDLYPKRTDQKLVYEQIISDLIVAEKSGLPETSSTGRVSLGAVKSFLSSVYLTMAGYPLNLGKPYYTLAAQKSKEVLDKNWYQLFANYKDLRNKSNENKGEFIFQNQYYTGIATTPITSLLLPRYRRISKFTEEVGALFVNQNFINSYDKNDERIKEQQYFFTEYPSISAPSEQVKFGGTYIFKYFDEEAALNTVQNDLNWTFMRLPEVLLIYAEAINESLGGPNATAYEAVNKIRRRAKLPDLNSLSQEEFREEVWKENYYELCFENKTWFTMARTRKVFNTTNKKFDNFDSHTFTYGPKLSSKYLLFPIPQREINNNKLLTQNPGW